MRAFEGSDSILNRAGWRSYVTFIYSRMRGSGRICAGAYVERLYVRAHIYVCMPVVLRAASILAPGFPHHAVGLTVCSGSINTFQFMRGYRASKRRPAQTRHAEGGQPTNMRVPHAYIWSWYSHEVSHSVVLSRSMAPQAGTLLHKTQSQIKSTTQIGHDPTRVSDRCAYHTAMQRSHAISVIFKCRFIYAVLLAI